MTNIIDLTLVELVNKIKKKEISSKEITKAYVDRCKKSKKLNTFITDDFDNALEVTQDVDYIYNFACNMGGMGFIEKLNELETKNVEPLTSIAETTLQLRKDEIKTHNIREQVLKNSPDKNKDFFVVPKVVE